MTGRRKPGADKWRIAIITLLIDGSKTRREIHSDLMRVYDPKDEARIDEALGDLVRDGSVLRPHHGHYMLPANR